MDSQQLLECDMKLSIQPLRFNIGEDWYLILHQFVEIYFFDINWYELIQEIWWK
jgi:hypothetical protein